MKKIVIRCDMYCFKGLKHQNISAVHVHFSNDRVPDIGKADQLILESEACTNRRYVIN